MNWDYFVKEDSWGRKEKHWVLPLQLWADEHATLCPGFLTELE